MDTAVHDVSPADAGDSAPLRALDRVTPRNLWVWAVIIALAGTAIRVFWFFNWRTDLELQFFSSLGAHAWGVLDLSSLGSNADLRPLAKAFAPAYGGLMKILFHAHTEGATSFTPGQAQAGIYTAWIDGSGMKILLGLQTAAVFATSLITFALARRVLFGWTALIPVALINLSVALFELPSRVAPEIWVMLLLTLAVWQAAILHERLAAGGGERLLLLTLSAGLTLGAAVLVNPGVLIVVPLIVWWAFRGLGREHATLLLVAAIVLPACWLAFAQSQIAGGLPTQKISTYTAQDAGNIVSSGSDALDRAYNVATPWNPRWGYGGFKNAQWNWESILPTSLTSDSTYKTATDSLVIILMIGYALLVLLGAIELFRESPGSASRLLVLPLPLLLLTFVTASGNVLRVNVLPFLAISLTLGVVWCAEQLNTGADDD